MMVTMHRRLALALALVLAACGGGGGSLLLPAGAPGRSPAGVTPAENATGLPGENATGLPGENATGLPGENATGLPGENATGLPGTQFSCAPVSADGQARCTLEIDVDAGTLADPETPASMIPGLHPADLQSAYGLPVQAAGGTIAVVDAYDDPTAESDLATYRSAFGLTPCSSADGCFRKVDQAGVAGNYPAANAGWANETALDLAMISAACPRCRILLVEANSDAMDDLGSSVDTAVSLGATAVSNSYYASEWASEPAEDAHYDHPDVAITASSGDAAAPFYPAASRFVTAVGGTSLARANGGWSETVWSMGGRGCSAYVARPAWQHRTGCSTRATVDMAAVADPKTGVAVFSTTAGGWIVAGGTSVGAPLLAGAYGLAGNGAGPAYAYAHPDAFRSIQGPGYGSATGLGAPAGIAGL
ncbi:MAG TPA: hypothetical protein VIG46_00780 [Candidatus Baltobacteraceae bacterium]